MTNIETSIKELRQTTSGLQETTNGLRQTTSEIKVSLGELTEFLRENMVTKDELNEKLNNFATKDDLTIGLNKQKHEILDKMDDKLFNLKGDLVSIMRMEADKAGEVIMLLKKKSVISLSEAKRLLALQPFPKQMN